ncbi:copper oxidase [Nakamurella silvestris]|nr:copper oxidase [Nakamurella silvestris]
MNGLPAAATSPATISERKALIPRAFQKRPPAAPFVAPNWGLQKFRDQLKIPPVINAPRNGQELVITSKVARRRLHSQLPPTTVWSYGGSFPGPTIVVQRNTPVNITWRNRLTGTIPLTGVEVVGPSTTDALAATRRPGWRDPSGAPLPYHLPTAALKDLEPWTVVHVHGACVNGVDDGLSTNGVGSGSVQRGRYPNGQAATTLWYHDHAMDITRFNVHAGLVGMYVVKDTEEQRLRLPRDQYDVPLIISDCNLDTDASGAPNGQLMFKIGVIGGEGGAPVPMTGPFNMANGTIWPRMSVGRRQYRFRLLNASVSRIYRLKLVDADNRSVSLHQAVTIIGTDGGLLPRPEPFPADGLNFAPAERVDVVIDFAALQGRKLVLTNYGTTNVEPDIMRFDVAATSQVSRSTVPPVLAASYRRLERGTTVPDDHDEVFIALAPGGSLNNLHAQLWELGEVTGHEEHSGQGEPGAGRIQLTDPTTGQVRTFVKRAGSFHDSTTLFFRHGRWTVWNFLHLGGPVHPMHIHLAQFQEIDRRQLDLSSWSLPLGGTTAPLSVIGTVPIPAYQQGWKDTFAIQPGQWTSVAGHFVGGTGAFMYHCHLLDHEDSGMMRPFLVRPASVAEFDAHGSMEH